MLRTRKPSRLAALALLLAAAASAGELPAAEKLLDFSLEPPAVAFQGRMMVTHWYGKQARAEEALVYHSPPNLTRREFLAPDGSVTKIVVSDGEREQVRLVKAKKVIAGDAVKTYEKVMPAEKERELLLKNYKLTVSGPEKVAGRSAWVLHMEPAAAGKPSQDLWIDQETRAILENKRYLPKKSFAALSRYSHFEPKKSLPDSLFALDAATAAIAGKGLEPDFMSLQQLNDATGQDIKFPEELPGGFLFESADFFTVGKHTVRHARYTDGLAVVSIFETDKPARLAKGSTAAVSAGSSKGAGQLRLSSSGKVLNFRRGAFFYTLMGDVTRELLQSIAAGLK